MQSSSHVLLVWLQVGLHGLLSLLVCAVFTVGWLRQRQLGFLILAAWAAVNATWALAQHFVMPVLIVVGSRVGFDQITMHMLVNLTSVAIMSVLMLAGASSLVFRGRKETNPMGTVSQ